MTTKEPQDDLTALFEADDHVLFEDAAAFTQKVDRRISRQILVRGGVLTAATLVGAIVAGTQVPSILLQLSSFDGVGLPMFDGLARQLSGQPFSVFALGFAALVSTVTVLSHDRI